MRKQFLIPLIIGAFLLPSCGGNPAGSATFSGVESTQSTSEQQGTEGLRYLLQDDDTYAVSIGDAVMLSNIIVPSTYRDKPVTRIFDFAGSDAKNGTLSLPSSIRAIESVGTAFSTIQYAGTFAEFEAINLAKSWWIGTIGEKILDGKDIYEVLPEEVWDYKLICSDRQTTIKDLPRVLTLNTLVYGVVTNGFSFSAAKGESSLNLSLIGSIPLLRMSFDPLKTEIRINKSNDAVSPEFVGKELHLTFPKTGISDVMVSWHDSSVTFRVTVKNMSDFVIPSTLSAKQIRIVEVPSGLTVRLWEWETGGDGSWYDMAKSGNVFAANLDHPNYLAAIFHADTPFSDEDRAKWDRTKVIRQSANYEAPESKTEKVTFHYLSLF